MRDLFQLEVRGSLSVSSGLHVASGRPGGAESQYPSRFRTGWCWEAMEGIFYQLVEKLETMREIDLKTEFMDGTKLVSCAGRYTFVRLESVEKHLAR